MRNKGDSIKDLKKDKEVIEEMIQKLQDHYDVTVCFGYNMEDDNGKVKLIVEIE